MLTQHEGGLGELDSRPDRPWFRANMIVSLDGVIAVDGDSAGLSGPSDRQVYRALRDQADAVVVGGRTATHPGYARLQRPLVIVTNSGDVRTSATAPIVLTTDEGAVRARATAPQAQVNVVGEESVDMALAHRTLVDRGLASLLCEGGPHLLRSLLQATLIDELCLTIAPMLIGEGPRLIPGLIDLPAMRLTTAAEDEGWLFARYAVLR